MESRACGGKEERTAVDKQERGGTCFVNHAIKPLHKHKEVNTTDMVAIAHHRHAPPSTGHQVDDASQPSAPQTLIYFGGIHSSLAASNFLTLCPTRGCPQPWRTRKSRCHFHVRTHTLGRPFCKASKTQDAAQKTTLRMYPPNGPVSYIGVLRPAPAGKSYPREHGPAGLYHQAAQRQAGTSSGHKIEKNHGRGAHLRSEGSSR